MMGYPPGWVEPAGSRNNQLRCLGNAVVPQVAEAFLRAWAYGDTGQPTDAPDRLLPTPEASDGTGGRRARNLRWDGDTAYRPSGHKASVSLREALDRINEDDAA